MTPKQLADEFQFLREKIEKACTLMIKGDHPEAAFILGCLHSICHNHHLGWNHIDSVQNPVQAPQPETQPDAPAV